MSIVTTSGSDWLEMMATHTLGELYIALLEETKNEHPYIEFRPWLHSQLRLYWIWMSLECRGLEQALMSVQSKLQVFIETDPG
jgi:hypothetical protein